MVFSSLIFLAVFLPLFLSLYYLTPMRFRSPLILAASYVFYAWWRIDFTALFAGVTLATYLVSVQLQRTGSRAWLAFGVIANLAVLGYFKYFNFGVEAWNAAFQTQWEGWRVILPIGVSFYIFHCISYLIDIHRKDAEVAKSYWDFAAFTALFPHLIAGPVLRYKDLAWQFQSRTHSWDKFNEGVLRFAMGFAKKVMIADTLAPLADMAFAQPNPTMAESWLGLLAYAAQLYFDFSGYSDMAVGLALMMGFRFIENFNHPYTSRSITEFWQRWHISLSTWLRDYLYISLGGNRKGPLRTYFNLFVTMLLGGLWHGANFTFVLWGAWHGALLVLERLLGGKSGSPYPKLLAWPITFFCVLMGWVLFRAPSMTVALDYFAGLFGRHGTALSDALQWQITPLMLATLAAAYLIAFLTPRLMGDTKRNWHEQSWAARVSLPRQMSILVLFGVSIAKLIAQSHSPFLYFQF